MAVRFILLIFIFALLYGALGFNLYRLQILKSDYYLERANARSELASQLELRRGQIFFTDKNKREYPVAFNKDYPVIYASPKEIIDDASWAKTLADTLSLNESDLLKSFQNKKSHFKLLVDRARPEEIAIVKKLNLKGVYVDKKQYRFYPFEDLGASLLGFVGINSEHDAPVGLYGIEKLYDEKLRKGENTHLTIDINLQTQAEKSLKNLIEKFKAVRGSVIIEEPATGRILALANAPGFDPNAYAKASVENFLNPTVQSIYEPGSVFKPLTMAAGIDSGVFTPETSFYDKGSVTLNGKKITNWDHKAHGVVTMTNVIEESINTGAIFAETLVGNNRFYEYLKKFGFGEKSNIELPDEAKGSLKNLERKNARAIDFATASFGQGTAVTSVQLISAFSSIANGGLLMRPYITNENKPLVVRRVMKEETAQKVSLMMESAVEKAHIAAIPEYRVAGKTGTAQIPDFKKGGYTEEYIHSYVGFAPASQARFVILFKLERPNVTLAGFTVVPAFQELARFVLNYYNIPPDKPSLITQEKNIL